MAELPPFVPTRAHLLVCTGPSCRRVGSAQLFAGVWQDFEAQKLAYYTRGGSLRLTESGCLGACARGPNVAVYHDEGGHLAQAWYIRMDRPAVVRLARALHEGAPLPTQNRFDR
jgi:(2Fe-2S) ferredoxin